ncbi:hypothetical protein [Leucobacter sp. M11]|uniref:hypothetical protein n=1 Tax=Leucobacter sp. M11 TaxID=2993565 RepID=UPI002D7F800F|nr:hypothetical protein [Leucobacter sp. M11]MEB4614008.1 hypothetical protein [Leucobacter sp. M11]
MIPLARKRAIARQADAQAKAVRQSQQLGRTGQVSRTTVLVADDDVPLEEGLSLGVDAAVTVENHEDVLAGVGDITDEVVTVLPDMTEDLWGVDDTAQEAGERWDGETERVDDVIAEQGDLSIAVDAAQAEAAEAIEAAANAQTTADGKNANYRGASEPQGSEKRPLVVGDQWWVEDATGRPVGLKIFTAFGWIAKTFEADQILVPGSLGAVVIKNGAITGVKIAADAIDGKIITGATVRTAATGQRTQIDAEGLRTFGADNKQKAKISADDEVASLVGGLRVDGRIVTYESTVPLLETRQTVLDKAGLWAVTMKTPTGPEVQRSQINSTSIFTVRFDQATGKKLVGTQMTPDSLYAYRSAPGTEMNSEASYVTASGILNDSYVGGTTRKQKSSQITPGSYMSIEYATQSETRVRDSELSPGKLAIVHRNTAGAISKYTQINGDQITTGKVTLTTDTDWVRLDGWTGGFGHASAPLYYRRKGGYVEFKGSLTNASWSGPLTSFGATMPDGFRPTQANHQGLPANAALSRMVNFDPDGRIRLYGSGASSAWWIFDQARYPID